MQIIFLIFVFHNILHFTNGGPINATGSNGTVTGNDSDDKTNKRPKGIKFKKNLGSL